MSDENQTFGGRFYSELRRLTGFDLITGLMDYNAIQKLKVSDRQETLQLFQGRSYEVIQLLKTAEPEAAAQYFVEKAKEAQAAGSGLDLSFLLLMNLM